jgi:hypothetical protein
LLVSIHGCGLISIIVAAILTPLPDESGKMTLDEYEKLPPEEKEHFAKCSTCGEIFDRRSLDEVLFHNIDHKHRPDIQYSGWEKLNQETTPR